MTAGCDPARYIASVRGWNFEVAGRSTTTGVPRPIASAVIAIVRLSAMPCANLLSELVLG